MVVAIRSAVLARSALAQPDAVAAAGRPSQAGQVALALPRPEGKHDGVVDLRGAHRQQGRQLLLRPNFVDAAAFIYPTLRIYGTAALPMSASRCCGSGVFASR